MGPPLDNLHSGPERGLVDRGGYLADAATDNRRRGDPPARFGNDPEPRHEAVLLRNQPGEPGKRECSPGAITSRLQAPPPVRHCSAAARSNCRSTSVTCPGHRAAISPSASAGVCRLDHVHRDRGLRIATWRWPRAPRQPRRPYPFRGPAGPRPGTGSIRRPAGTALPARRCAEVFLQRSHSLGKHRLVER